MAKLKSLKDFMVRMISVVDKGDNPGATVELFKSVDKVDKKVKSKKKGGDIMKTVEEILKGMEKEDVKVIEDEIAKIKDVEIAKSELDVKVEGLEKDKKDLEEVVDSIKKVKPVVDTSDEELIKSADPKIQKMLEKAKIDAEEVIKLKKEKEEEVAKARKVELSKEAELYPNLGSPVEDIVEIFSKLDGDEKTIELIKGIFGAVNKALEGTELIKAIGTEKDPIVKSAEEELEEKAIAMVEKDGITIETARSNIIKSDPDKYMK